MPRVTHVKAARKDYPEYNIKKGESYYWWKFRHGGKRVSKTYPKQSQLTQSAFLGTIYDIGDRISELSSANYSEPEDLKTEVDEIVSELEDLKSETESSRDNMPEHLQDVGSGEMLGERIENLETMIDELEGIDCEDYDEPSDEDLRAEVLLDLYSISDEDSAEEEELEEIDEAAVKSEIETLRQEKFIEWCDDKITEIQNVTYEGS